MRELYSRDFNGGLALSFLYYLLLFVFGAGVFALLWFMKDKRIVPRFSNKQLVAILCGVLYLMRFIGGHYKIKSTIGLNISSPFGTHGEVEVVISALLLWFIAAANLALITFIFFEDTVPIVASIVRYFAPVVYILSAVFLPTLNRAMDGELADGFHWRLLIFALELGALLALSVYEFLTVKHKPKAAREYGRALLILLGMLLITMPCWVPQCLFGMGDPDIKIDDFNIYHRIALYGSLLFVFPVHYIFHRKEYEQRRYALIFISLATLISYCYRYTYTDALDMTLWPLHLCNTAMFIIPFVLIFKLDKLYYFTLFINVLGAFLAMILPNVEHESWFGAPSVEFWLNHYMAMMLPILIMSLKIFPRPKIRQFVYSLIAFFFYYGFVLFANAYFTGKGESVDFFFINSDFIASKLGEWAEDLRDFTLVLDIGGVKAVIYPVYQTLYFAVYVLLAFAMWFIYVQIFEIADVYTTISERNRKVKADMLALEAHLAGRSMQEPMNPENEGKLILRHFSKSYSTSDVYAVYDASLEIEGGQIFGFLGPNGAGKSTIIKSIVGIQTISSGEIEISGYDVEKQAVGAKMQIGFVPDHYALYENLSGREYINYIADLYNVSRADRDARIADYVARFRLESAIDNPIKTYSHGMKQKITIMSALVHDPKVWILDEPLTGLDPESIFQVKECMKAHAAKGNIVFFSSHIIDVVERICDRIAIIRKGRILAVKTIKEIEESGMKLEEYYLGMIDGNSQEPVPVTEGGKA